MKLALLIPLLLLTASVTAEERDLQTRAFDAYKAMVQVDQAARTAFIASNMKDATLGEKMSAVDRKNTARMKAIVAAKGWPREPQRGHLDGWCPIRSARRRCSLTTTVEIAPVGC